MLWAALFVATGAGAILSLQRNAEAVSSVKDYPKISVTDTAGISSITFAKGNLQNKLYQKAGQQWSVNNKYQARPQLIKLLLFGLSKLEVKRPIPAEDAHIWVSQMQQKSVRVTLDNSSAISTFYIMPNPTDPNSSIYADDAMKSLYIVHVPGVKGDLATLIALGENDWRSKDIFRSSVYSMHALTINYEGAKADNFKIEFKDNAFSIPNFPNADSIKIKKYLSLIPILGVDKFLDEKVDSVKALIGNAQPYATLAIEDDIALRSETVKLYFSKGSKIMLAQMGTTKEWATLSPQMWRYALVPKRFFEKKKE